MKYSEKPEFDYYESTKSEVLDMTMITLIPEHPIHAETLSCEELYHVLSERFDPLALPETDTKRS